MVDGGSVVDICPRYTLQSLKISTDRIRTNNVYVRAFDGAKQDFLGEIYLIVTIGPAELELCHLLYTKWSSLNPTNKKSLSMVKMISQTPEILQYHALRLKEVVNPSTIRLWR